MTSHAEIAPRCRSKSAHWPKLALTILIALGIASTQSSHASPAGKPGLLSTASAAITAGSVSYAYDSMGRLVQSVVPALNIVENYSYDAGGNLLSVTSSPLSELAVSTTSTAQSSPGSTITIYGSGFSTLASGNVVLIGGVSATVVSATATQLVVVIPAGAVSGLITVTTGSTTVTSSSPLTVKPAPGSPTITNPPALATPGSQMIITGSGFQTNTSGNQVFIGSTPVPVVTATATALTVAVPPLNNYESFAAAAGLITVTTPFGTATTSTPTFFSSTNFGPIGSIAVGGGPTSLTTTSSQYFYALTFSGTAGQNLAMSFAGVRGLRAGVYAPDGSSLADPGNISFSSDGGVQIPTLPTTGVYVMEIWSPNTVQTVNVSVLTPVTGTLTLNGSPVHVVTTTGGQSASLTFSGNEGDYIALNLSSVTFSAATVQIRSPDGSLLSSLPIGTSGTTLRPQLPATGTYTVDVIPSAYSQGSFTASLNSVSTTLAADQGPYTVALTSGQAVTIPFEATAGQYLSLAGIPSGTVSSASLAVTRPDGSELTESYWSSLCTTCSSPVLNMGPLTQNGTHLITLVPNGTGNITLYLSTPLSLGELSPSQYTTSPATVLGQAVIATFTDTVGDYPAIMVSGGHHGANTQQYTDVTTTVLATDQTVVAASRTTNETFPLNLGPIQQNNTYTVLVQQTSATAGQSIGVEWLPAAAPALPSGANPPTVNLLAGQALAGTFSATAGQYADLTIAEPFLPIGEIAAGSFYVVAPNGAVIGPGVLSTLIYCAIGGGGNTACGLWAYTGSGTSVFGPLPQSGTYTVVFQQAAGGAGAAGLVPTITLGPPGTTTVGSTTSQTMAGTTFSAAAGQFISIDLSSSTAARFLLLDPSGAVIAGPLDGSKILSFGPLPTTGTYTVVTQNAAPSVSLTVAAPVKGNLTLGSPSTASIALPGQGAQYSFSGTAGQYYTATVSETSGNINGATVSIVSSGGATIASTTLNPSCDATCTGSISFNVGPLSASDTYSLLVQPTNLFGSSTTSALTLQVTGSSGGGTTTQNFSAATPGTSAQFTFQGAAGQSFNFALTNVVLSAAVQYGFQIIAPNGAYFYGNNCAGSTCGYQMPVLPQTGTYTVTVTPNSSATITGTATLSTTLYAGPLTIGTPIDLTLASGQFATMKFDATDGQTLSVALSGVTPVPSYGYYSFQVVNSAGQSLGFASAQSSGTLNLPHLAAGTYTVNIYPAGGYSTLSGSMQVALALGLADTLPLTGNGVSVSTPTPGDIAYFTFPAVAGHGYSFTVSSLATDPSSVTGATVYPPAFTFSGIQTNCYSPGCVTHLAYATNSQDYTIPVVPNGQAKLSFVATLSPDVEATLDPGVPLNISLAAIGQTALLTFNVTSLSAPALLYSSFVPNPSSASYNLSVYNLAQNYTYVTSTTLSGGTASGAFNLPTLQPGTYVVIVKPNAPTVASLQLTFDPNATAILPVTGSMAAVTTSAPGENAYLSFSGTAGQTLTLALTGLVLTPSSSSNLTLIVTSPNSTLLLNTTCTPTANGCELTLPNLPQTGTYTVSVTPPSSSAMSFTAMLPSVVAGTLTVGTPATVNWTLPGQSAAFSFSLPSQKTVAVNVSSITTTPANSSVNVSVYNSSGVMVGVPIATTTAGSVNLANLAAGNYKVVVSPASPVTGSLQLTLEPGAGGAQPMDGSSTAYSISAAGQNAYITFAATAGQSVNVALTHLTLSSSSPNYISWSITAPDGSTAVSNTTCYVTGAGCSGGIITLSSTGTYTVNIVPQPQQTMSFTATVTPNLTGTLAAGTTQALNLSLLGQDARFTFTVAAGQSLTAGINAIATTPANTTIWMGVYTPSGAYVMGNATSTGETLNLANLAPGNYILWIAGETAATGTMQMSLTAPSISTSATDGSPTNVNITGIGQSASLKFSANAGDSLTTRLTNLALSPASPNYVSWSVIGPDGSTVDNAGNCAISAAAGCVGGVLLAPLTGTYSINVQPQGPQTMSFTLGVSEVPTSTLTSGVSKTINFNSQIGDGERFAFTVGSGQSYVAALAGINTSPANTQVWMGVYTPTGAYVTGAATTTGETLNLNLSPGNYLLWIANLTPATTSLQFTFH